MLMRLYRANTRRAGCDLRLCRPSQAAHWYWLMTPPRSRVRRTGPSNATTLGSWLGGCWSRLWVWTVVVEVVLVLGKDAAGVTFVVDEYLVGALGADTADEPF